jgi:hypothetical protein
MTSVNSAAAIAAPGDLPPALPDSTTDVAVRAYFLGQSIDLTALPPKDSAAASAPLIVTIGNQGQGVLFSYGAVVLIVVEVLLSLYDLFLSPR